ncbi:hypothetical protein [Aphanizomenon flos-aquae]|uniref:hypothetical protein n=1 Tax=Aphanizomenon flos-aquae TaxID=1176 RepID=UPI000A802BAD|nr:hypothetical protein [Aphanizomenon flos-aquae]
MKIVVMARQKALMQEARVKRVWAILHFFTQFGFIVFTYLYSIFIGKVNDDVIIYDIYSSY